jgi:oxygen-independent coproporphyrinogen-3 oxidase
MAGIYIHIPFCRTLCPYCNFYHIISQADNKEFINALLKEIILRREYIGDEKISTIYLGGGTPSVLSTSEIIQILNQIMTLFQVENDCEFTIEINPDDVTQEYINDLKNTNINRISLGIQSWRDSDLKLLNRRHDSQKAIKALENTIKAGFENITIDLIYGIPGMNSIEWSSNLEFSFSYDIKHLSAYHLTIEPNTVFAKMRDKGLITETDEEESSAQFHILIEKAETAGFIQYEISNFGKPGFFSKHNSNYWKQINYLGIGPSAHSFNGFSRQWNISNVKKYIKAVNNGLPIFEREDLDKRTRFNEYIMTSLRTMWGIDLDYVEKVFEKEGYDYIINIAGKLVDYGLMKQDKKTLVLTNQGKMISDNIISELMLPGDE